MSIQSQGWNFNTHTNYKSLSLDSDNKVPLTCKLRKSRCKPTLQKLNYTIRNGFLYDMEKHTDVFTSAPSKLT